MSTDRNYAAPPAEELSPTRALIANAAGWLGLILLVAWALYWGVTGQNFDLTAKILLIVGLLALGTFGLMNPQGILDIAVGRATRNIFGTVVMVLLSVGIVVAINMLYNEMGKRNPSLVLRTDLTEGKQYSLSPQSIRVAGEMTDTVTVYGFFGNESFELTSQREADNLLKEYSKYTSKMRVQFVNPDVDFALAGRYGLTRRGVVVFDNGSRHETAESNTEEAFTGALLRLRNATVKKVAFLNIPSLVSFGGGGGAQAVPASAAGQALATENYTVLAPINPILSATLTTRDVDVIIVPPAPVEQPIQDATVRLLLTYLDNGGHVLLIGDPQGAPLPAAILQKYGITENRGLIGESNRSLLWAQNGNPLQFAVTTYPGNTITRDMTNLPTIYAVVGGLIAPTGVVTGFTVAPFLQSSSEAILFKIVNDPSGQPALQPDPAAPPPPYNIGLTVEQNIEATGSFTDTATQKPIQTRLVVISDADFVADDVVQRNSINLDLFKNIVNWLSQSEERISVRPQDATNRQITLNDQQQSLIAWGTIVFLPLLALLGGGLVWWRRR